MNRPPHHPLRCWVDDGHERCALGAAGLAAEQRAVWFTARARLFRKHLTALDRGLPLTEVPPGVLDAARKILGVAPVTTVTRHGAR